VRNVLPQIDEQLSAGQQRLKPTTSLDDQRDTAQMTRVADPWCWSTWLPGVGLHWRCDVMEESILSEPGRQRPASRKTPIICCRLKRNNYIFVFAPLLVGRFHSPVLLSHRVCSTLRTTLLHYSTAIILNNTTETDTKQQNIHIVTFQHTNVRQHRMLTRI